MTFTTGQEKIRLRNKNIILSYLSTHPCIDCGEDDPIVLEFDHVDPTTKTKSIANMLRSFATVTAIQEEINKCVVRCANCHRRRTYMQLGYNTRT